MQRRSRSIAQLGLVRVRVPPGGLNQKPVGSLRVVVLKAQRTSKSEMQSDTQRWRTVSGGRFQLCSMMHFSKEFLEKYSAATYVAILAASEEAYRTGWIAPDKDKDPCEHVSANTAATTTGSGADTAAREQTTMGEGAANNNSESNQSAPAEHALSARTR